MGGTFVGHRWLLEDDDVIEAALAGLWTTAKMRAGIPSTLTQAGERRMESKRRSSSSRSREEYSSKKSML